MKSYLYLFFSLILFTSCISDDDFDPETEEDIIQYLDENNLAATKTASGLYYITDDEGTGKTPTVDENPIVNVEYKISLLDGITIGESNVVATDLNQDFLLLGLKEGLQLFKEGGEGTLILPYNLAYGTTDYDDLPAGSVVIFDVKVNAVYPDYESQNEGAILQYVADNNLTATKTESGLYYVINDEGTGTQPTNLSNVTVAYKGSFLDGTVFDESDFSGIPFNLSQVIQGWTEGIQLFKEGGEGILLVPYYLGYGETAYNTIPGYSVLVFDVNLISVND